MSGGKGIGTGSPMRFRCRQCRKNERDWRNPGKEGLVVKLTGRTKKRASGSPRHGYVMREYKCPDCDHVGWSSHVDLTHSYITAQ